MKKGKKRHKEDHSLSAGSRLRNIILGGQDGLVNVLGVILAVASATFDPRIVIVAGLAATFAESISMAAVAYTSSKAVESHYKSQLEQEKKEIKEIPRMEKKEIYDIYYKKGFRGSLLNSIVKKITSSRKLWLSTMMEEELHLYPSKTSPLNDAVVVGVSAIVGSLVPLVPFLILTVQAAIITSLIFSLVILFATGYIKNKITIGSPWKGGFEIAFIGMAAALIGYGIGAFLGVALYLH